MVIQLEEDGKLAIHAAEAAHGLGPVDSALEGHQVVVFQTVVVVNVGGANALLKRLKRRPHARAQVSVSGIEADVQVQPGVANKLQQAFGRAESAGNIFHQDFGAPVFSEEAQVLERGEGGVELAQVVLLLRQPQVHD